MKRFLRGIVAGFLAIFARMVLAKYRPYVVMITGSVGKTSTKDAVAAALSVRFDVRASEKSYNSEFGVPLTILGSKNPWNDLAAWFTVFTDALGLIVFRYPYPKLLVLEVGADRPGDLRHILDFVTPDAVVVTRLPDVPVHVEAYASPEAVREEEFLPACALVENGPLVVSSEDEYTKRYAARLSVPVVTFGFTPDADVALSGESLCEHKNVPTGTCATATVKGATYQIIANGALGHSQVYAPAAALALALALGMSPKEALKGLARYAPPAGRGRILSGTHGSLLIDDTYNASPAAVEEILRSLTSIRGSKRRIAVLGDMLELGRYSAQEHARIGTLAARYAQVVVSVGQRARAITEAAKKEGADTMSFTTSDEAADTLKSFIQKNDVVLIKGSQSIRMERITEALLADPSDKAQLVRQDKEWKLVN
ncbi:UDP-N-acetylmuramoyl-tripeptide--D-alanyl-D-alanine ligase [Candidatus Parcubacteria bacterium]|nr:UDP-N-acetylmuramoyl-tripeptide--D-alanyl-D-alanine ligase [Candidatus Parcubacteria bacterium]